MMNAQQAVELPSQEDLEKLARDDPLAFEALRQAIIASFIEQAPRRVRERLRGVQFQVDGIRRLAHSPLGATVKIYGLMWDRFLQMNDELQGFAALVSESPPLSSVPRAVRQPAPPAKILPFQQRSCAAHVAEDPCLV